MTITSPITKPALSEYNPSSARPWNEYRAKHFYRRLACGAPQSVINIALQKDPKTLASQFVKDAINKPNTPAPKWAHWANKDFNNYWNDSSTYRYDLRRKTIEHFMKDGLKGRLALFWMNHFVTDIDTYKHAPYMYQYWNILQKHSIGNFEDFVRDIGKTPAMLYYLDGFYNTKNKPNENYARELYELFTLGANHGCTQFDIKETARALTGYTHVDSIGADVEFDPNDFDNTNKNLFGQVNKWNYGNVITILFQKKGRHIAKFIAEKLYKYFVCPEVDKKVVQAMADVFFESNYEIAPMLEQLFRSEHFFDDSVIGTIIKSPYDLLCSFLTEGNFNYKVDHNDKSVMETYNYIHYVTTGLGQRIYKPIDQKGWQRDESWLTGSSIIYRMKSIDDLVMRLRAYQKNQLLDFVKNITNNSSDTYYIAKTFLDHFVSKPLSQQDYKTAEVVLRWQVPENYYTRGKWSLYWNSAEYQVLMLFKHLLTIPEFQLK
ncbi:DUF1800 family protein [Leeuwenhoekiella sp. A16]|uniref:DUF1800 domain-containing protein n=1 Tax=unclassified Leeuwenhoekiella TaxID=2615029 RepID=UPI003A8067CC